MSTEWGETPPAVEVTVATGETPETPKGETPALTAEQLEAAHKSAQQRIHELNKESEKHRKRAEALETEKRQAAEASLAAQGQHKELATQREQERDAAKADLATATDKLARYEQLLSADIEQRIKDWPTEVKKLVPSGEGVDALSRLERMAELEPLATKLLGAPATRGLGVAPVPNNMPATQKDAPRPGAYRF